MGAVFARFELVLLIERDTATITESSLLQSIGQDVLRDVSSVAHAIDIADFVSVIGRYWNFRNTHAGIVQLNYYLSIEIEAIIIPSELYLLQRRHRVYAVAGMKLREISAKSGILESRNNAVPYIFVQ